MTLAEFANEIRLQILDDLIAGRDPGIGTFSPEAIQQARTKGLPQLGAVRFEPSAVVCEYIYSAPDGNSQVVSVTVPSPARIVFLPVPAWVVESIWQGEIDGSYHFEQDAMRLLDAFTRSLSPTENPRLFGMKTRVGRDA